MGLIRFFCLSFIFYASAGSNLWATETNLPNILLVYSEMKEPYSSFMTGFNEEVKKYKAPIQFNKIILNNRERTINHFLSTLENQEFPIAIAVGTIALRALRDQTTIKTPFTTLFGVVSDPIGEKVIHAFYEKPSKAFSGVSFAIDIRDRLRDMKRVFPHAKNIGAIYSTMPQSLSYKKWLLQAQKETEFSDLNFIFRRVGQRNYLGGHAHMVQSARQQVNDLKDRVDLFLSPNDQMGIHPDFSKMIVEETKKPVFGLGKNDVLQDMGAVASSYPRIKKSGQRVAQMLIGLLQGQPLSDFPPEVPKYDLIFNDKTAQYFNIQRP